MKKVIHKEKNNKNLSKIKVIEKRSFNPNKNLTK